MEEKVWSRQIQYLELLIVLLVIPVLWYCIKYLYLRYHLYSRNIGRFTDSHYKATVEIKYPFFGFGKFVIDATEPAGQIWRGVYKIDVTGLVMTGNYIWNISTNKSVPDIGEHILTFSVDKSVVIVNWRSLSGTAVGNPGRWIKVKPNK